MVIGKDKKLLEECLNSIEELKSKFFGLEMRTDENTKGLINHGTLIVEIKKDFEEVNAKIDKLNENLTKAMELFAELKQVVENGFENGKNIKSSAQLVREWLLGGSEDAEK